MTAQQLTETVFALPPEAQRQIDDFIAFIHKNTRPRKHHLSRVFAAFLEGSCSASPEQLNQMIWL